MKRVLSMLMWSTVVVALTTAGCQSFGGRSGELSVDDQDITGSVKSKLVAEQGANLTLVDVAAKKGTVYLNGEVASPTQKARAEELAWQVAGVRNVVNNLQIRESAGSPAVPESDPTMELAPQ